MSRVNLDNLESLSNLFFSLVATLRETGDSALDDPYIHTQVIEGLQLAKTTLETLVGVPTPVTIPSLPVSENFAAPAPLIIPADSETYSPEETSVLSTSRGPTIVLSPTTLAKGVDALKEHRAMFGISQPDHATVAELSPFSRRKKMTEEMQLHGQWPLEGKPEEKDTNTNQFLAKNDYQSRTNSNKRTDRSLTRSNNKRHKIEFVSDVRVLKH